MPKFRKNFTERHLSALYALSRLINATPQAIANSQNMTASRDYWRNYLKDMEDEKWLTSKLITSTAKTGTHGRKLGTLFALTEKGAGVLAETQGIDPSEVFYQKSGIHASSPFQFPHRAEFIELLGLFLGHEHATKDETNNETGKRFEMLDLVPYYRYDGSNRFGTGHARTRVSVTGEFKTNTLIPDAVMHYRVGDTTRLVAIELHRETDTKSIIEQLRKHAAAIDASVFPAMFDHHASNHVLSIHTDADKLRKVRERIEAGEFPEFKERYSRGYHFATVADIHARGITEACYQLTGEKSGIFV